MVKGMRPKNAIIEQGWKTETKTQEKNMQIPRVNFGGEFRADQNQRDAHS